MTARILLAVDDDDAILDFIGTVAGSLGFEFQRASSGNSCLELLEKVEPNIILMDINMPDMDGMETVEKIREKFPKLDCPLIFLTARRDFASVSKSAELGSAAYMLKPITEKRLVERLTEIRFGTISG